MRNARKLSDRSRTCMHSEVTVSCATGSVSVIDLRSAVMAASSSILGFAFGDLGNTRESAVAKAGDGLSRATEIQRQLVIAS